MPRRKEVPELENMMKYGRKKFVRYEEGAKLYSMGLHTFQELAKEAGAIYHVTVIFVLDDQADEKEYAEMTGLPKRTLLVVNGKSKAVEEEVKRYIALQYFYSKKDELAEDDPSVVNELALYLSEQVAIVEELIRKWRSLQDPGTFVMNNGNLIDITSEKEFSDVLSDIMDAAFDKTPMINNDLLTKNNLTGAIRLARKKAVECIMGQEDIYEGCPNLSPEYNILRAALSKTGIADNKRISKKNRVSEDEMLYLPDERHTISGNPVMNRSTCLLLQKTVVCSRS